MKGRVSKTGIVLVGCMLVCLIMFLAVGVPNGFFGDGGKGGDLDDDNTPKIGEVLSGESPILVFDQSEGARTLMTAFDKGTIESVELLYDEGGAGESYTTDDQTEIREAYKALKNITVTGESGSSGTDSGHSITFHFADGGSYSYNFEGQGTLVYGDKNYEISGSDAFFDFVQEKCN